MRSVEAKLIAYTKPRLRILVLHAHSSSALNVPFEIH